MRQRLLLLLLLTGLSVVLFGSPPPSAANTITVDGTCTLADAIIAANTDTASGNCPAGSVGPDTIVLDVDVSLTSVYPGSTAIGGGQSGLPDITSDITIQSGLQDLIEGNNTTFRLVYVAPGASLTIDGADFGNGKIVNAAGAALGGAIYSDGTLDISNSTFFLNDVDGDDAGGGAIYIGASGSLSIDTSNFASNTSTGTTSSYGGSIYALGPITSIANADIFGTSSGSGGGIAADTITSIQDSDISGEAQEYGGGVYVTNLGSITGGAFGGIAFYGGATAITHSFTTITGVSFDESYAVNGGALWINSTSSATGIIDASDFGRYCSGDDGGAIWLGTSAVVDITDSEFDAQGIFGSWEWPCNTMIDPQNVGGTAIYSKGSLDISGSTFTHHEGLIGKSTGAVHNDNGTLLVEDSHFGLNQAHALNSTSAAGGAIYSEGSLTIARTEFFGNDIIAIDNNVAKGGAVYSSGHTQITQSTFLFSLAISDPAWVDNFGGAIYAEGQAEITNSLFRGSMVGNYDNVIATGYGGAIYLDADQNSTISHNTFTVSLGANGESIYASGPVSIAGNIFASVGDPDSGNMPDCMLLGGVTGVNNLHLDGDTSCDSISSGTIELGVHVNESDGLLQSVFGNPAIDGNPGCGLATDGLGNPRIGACDIGYHELQLDNPTPTPTFTPTFTPSLTPTFTPTVPASLTPSDTPVPPTDTPVPPTDTPSGPSALVVTATCVNENLAVTISAGDGPFNITASAGINTPVNGVSIGTTTINGPEKWDNLTVKETSGDGQSVNLGQFKCRTDERPVPLTPAHRSRTTDPFPLFSWTAISNANNYRVFVFDDKVAANRTVDIRQNSGGPTSLTLSTPLPDGRLFWRVRGRTNRVWGLWSVRFTLFKDPVAPVIANTPVPTIELEPPSGAELTPTPIPTVGPAPTFPAPPNSR